MEYRSFESIRDSLLIQGRTWSDEGVLHFNWTCSGFEVSFQGDLLTADLVPDFSIEHEGSTGNSSAAAHRNWPWLAVYADGAEDPCRRFEVNAPAGMYSTAAPTILRTACVW